MKTQIFIVPSREYDLIAEVMGEFARHRSSASLECKGATWELTIEGLCVTIPVMLKELPLMLSGLPIRFIRVSDTVEGNSLQLGYSAVAGAQGRITPVKGSKLEISVDGSDLPTTTALFENLIRGKVRPKTAYYLSVGGYGGDDLEQ